VTIIAHSNGGLVAKALLQKLGPEAGNLVDKVIFVAVPQSGAPETISDLLFGQDFIYKLFSFIPYHIVSKSVVREFTLNSPMAYHLLPSQAYFDSVQDPNRPVVLFEGTHIYSADQAQYGSTIDTAQELSHFILGTDGRSQPAVTDTKDPAIGNPNLTSYTSTLHSTLDAWTPPVGVSVFQIAGWGNDSTIAGIDFYEQPKDIFGTGILGYSGEYRPIFTEDGDGTVPVPSALLMSTSTDNVKRYWANLKVEGTNHGTILSSAHLKEFIGNLISGDATVPESVSETPFASDASKKLIFVLHSPLTLELYDKNGNHTGLNGAGLVEDNIPSTHYGEFGDVKYAIAAAGSTYKLVMKGQGNGTFSLDIQEQSGNTVTQTTTLADIPVTSSTLAALTITSGAIDASSLQVDENGDGSVDYELAPRVGRTLSIYKWIGFLQPVNDVARQVSLLPSVFKSGSTVPVKFQLQNANGMPVQSPTLPEWLQPKQGAKMSAFTSEAVSADSPTSGTYFKWDPVTQQYIYNWNTKGFPTGYWYKIAVRLDDGTTRFVTVGLR
jgi:hypothetical protein